MACKVGKKIVHGDKQVTEESLKSLKDYIAHYEPLKPLYISHAAAMKAQSMDKPEGFDDQTKARKDFQSIWLKKGSDDNTTRLPAKVTIWENGEVYVELKDKEGRVEATYGFTPNLDPDFVWKEKGGEKKVSQVGNQMFLGRTPLNDDEIYNFQKVLDSIEHVSSQESFPEDVKSKIGNACVRLVNLRSPGCGFAVG